MDQKLNSPLRFAFSASGLLAGIVDILKGWMLHKALVVPTLCSHFHNSNLTFYLHDCKIKMKQ